MPLHSASTTDTVKSIFLCVFLVQRCFYFEWILPEPGELYKNV